MNPHSRLRFVLGIIRQPSQAWRRIREVTKLVFAPALSDKVPSGELADVEVIPVESNQLLQEILVAIYIDNPSPFVNGPKSSEQLLEKKDRGVRFFLVRNNQGKYVGARAFDPSKKTLQNTVTEYHSRGKGYQLAAGDKLRELLAKEGHTEFRATVLRTNTRIQRTMQAAGWDMAPDPDNLDLIRGTLRLDNRSRGQ